MQVAVRPDPSSSPPYFAHLSADRGKIGEMSYAFESAPPQAVSAIAVITGARTAKVLIVIAEPYPEFHQWE
jgi:hypothetical protein